MKKDYSLKTRSKWILAILFVIVLLFSLGACGNSKAGGSGGGGIDIVVGGGEKDTDSDPRRDPGRGKGDPAPDPVRDRPGVNEHGQDLTGFPYQDELVVRYPEYIDSISWYEIPRDYIGGLGEWVVPGESVTTYVNIREKPSTSAKVIGELRHTDDMLWWRQMEFYVDYEANQLVCGIYKVSADKYTWTPVEKYEDGVETAGWVALEMVDLCAL